MNSVDPEPGHRDATVIELSGRTGRRPRGVAASPVSRGLRYEQVIELVEQLIVELRLQPGDLLPTQVQIGERAGVSLITVRRALDELERRGRVRRHQGVGTFLAHPKIISRPTLSGGLAGTLDGRADRSRIATSVLGVRRVLPGAAVAAALQVGTADPLWEVRRLRLLRGNPTISETALIPVALAPGLDDVDDEHLGSLYELLATRYGLRDDYEEQYLEVVGPDPEQRRLLGLPARTQVVRIRGLSVDTSGVPFDCFEQVYPAHGVVFAMSGSTARQLLTEPVVQDWATRDVPGAPCPRRPRDDLTPG